MSANPQGRTNIRRRRLLQGAAAGALLAPCVSFGQSGFPALLRAPRRALVIGNSRYRQNPLRNPVNDARALTQALKRTGFQVTTGTDLGQAQMSQAIEAYADEVTRSKAVGLFYFAGHGVQLAWRNYLLPVDAAISSIEEVQKRCVDLNTVIEGIARAANPMNILVLDACRENPFGRDFRVEQKGLSQLDAPPGTLLAYATSPGNVASDGEGDNGLYTEQLLREMQVPEAKIEDVFKRVRLAVRRGSKGFIPPQALKRLSEEEAERELWERAKDSREPAALEDYLKRYPSGRFAELAPLRLDRVLAQQGEQRIEIVASPENPYTKGSAVANTRYKVGDSYTYRVFDLFTKEQQREITTRITAATDTEVIYNNGAVISDLLGNPLKAPDGRRYTANQNYPAEFAVGKRWTSRFSVTHPRGMSFDTELDFRIVKRERVRVPAGEFDTFRVEATGRAWSPSMRFALRVSGKAWFAPDKCRLPVAREQLREAPMRVLASERFELVAFKEA